MGIAIDSTDMFSEDNISWPTPSVTKQSTSEIISTALTSHRVRVVDEGTVDTDDLTRVRQFRPRVVVANGYQPVEADLNEYG